MKSRFWLFIMIILCLILQCTLMPAISIANVCPNLMIIFIVSMGLMRGKTCGLLVGFFCGILCDLSFMVLGYYVVGFRAFIYMMIGYLCGYCYRIFYDDDIKMPVLLTTISDFCYGILVYTFQFLLRGRVGFFYYLKRIILPEVVYTIVLTLVLYRFFLSINRKIEKADKRSVDSFV